MFDVAGFALQNAPHFGQIAAQISICIANFCHIYNKQENPIKGSTSDQLAKNCYTNFIH